MRYLLDANIFIEAKNRYYAFDICPGFWDWMDHVVGGDVASTVNVRDELCAGNDELAAWARARHDADWFLKVDDHDTQRAFRDVAATVAAGGYTPAAMSKFLAGADPWLIAKAKALGATLVTHEVMEAPQAKKRVPIPNICKPHGVVCANTFDALRALSCSLSFRT